MGALGQGLGLVVLTMLLNPESSFVGAGLPLLDSSGGWRTPLYWAQLVTVAVVTPLSFVLNKLWTFAEVARCPSVNGG